MKYGYARVSTIHQDLHSQISLLKKQGCEDENIYQDKFTGTKKSRPAFNQLLNELGEGDQLYVTKIDRLARSITDLSNIVQDLQAKKVSISFIKDNIEFVAGAENNSMQTLLFNVLGSFAQFERDLIIERTSEGREIAKQNPNYKEGRPTKFSKKQKAHAISLLDSRTYKEVEEMTGISKSTLIRARRRLK
ncbi:recombinase family protein [Lentibacillus sp. CBA3610]|uniref:recombinase family protein n=1 Tax=Lentibacillus sp. CBA3610 TaxID=2518176 RepID=UPI001595D581|nr:recombinase family protein [Lentibacillus sp. CBA3610]QKY69332.1 recombinase family protein [Lentibacillus sp. CBA3610]